jgi:hypothetical protein
MKPSLQSQRVEHSMKPGGRNILCSLSHHLISWSTDIHHQLTVSDCPLNFMQPSSQPGFKFLKWDKNAEMHKTNDFNAFFKLETSNKNYIQNDSIYVYMKYHSNQSLFTQLSVHSLTVILIFTNFCLKYITELKK